MAFYLSGTIGDTFVSDGLTRLLTLPFDPDWMTVTNYTNTGATGDDSIWFYWQRGMVDGTGIREFKSGGGNTTNKTVLAAPAGFTLIDTTQNPLGTPVALTATTNAVQPVISTANTQDLVAGDVVRLYNIANVPNLGAGFDFTIDTVVANTSFRIQNALANAPGAVGGAGTWAKVRWPAYWYPQRRWINNISQAAQAVVTPSVDIGPSTGNNKNNFIVGQRVKFVIPPAFSMVELDGVEATIVAVAANGQSFTVDVDTTTFTAFTYPVVADVPTNYAHVFCFGETATSPYENLLDDAVENVGVRAMQIGGGADAPGGGNNDVMYWVAGRFGD